MATIEGIRNDVSDLISDSEQSLKRVGAETADRARAIGSTVGEKLESGKAQLQEFQSQAIDRAREAATVTARYARERPLQTLGIVALVGVAIGLLLNRRS